MSYQAPVKDMLFCMTELAGLEQVATLPGFEEAGVDTAQAVLEECARFNEGVLAPLNAEGDKTPSSFADGRVTTTPGFKDAYRQYAEGGWQGLQHPLDFGGQGLPKTIGAACIEINNSANLSFALCPLLTDGAIEALLTAGSDELKQRYLPRMVSGEWTGTMNLTEPQAGSDLALVRTRAEPQADGSYKVFGTKIFITYGEHDMAENIVHLVLARVTGAPEGVKGISLFVVPKFMVDADGSLGARNDVHCVSIEHKLGIKASPTAVLQFGDQGGAVGYLVGEENRGLDYMFIMMNAARYARRRAGHRGGRARLPAGGGLCARSACRARPVDGSLPGAGPIIHHPDVKRMLLTMRALTEGCRALALGRRGRIRPLRTRTPTRRRASSNQAFYEFLVPLVKGFSTEMSLEVGEPGRAGARRHGLHRGDRRRAAPARRADPDHLRRHDRDPGQRPGRPQDARATAARWRGPSPRRSRPPKASCAPAAAPTRWRGRGAWPRRAGPSSTSSSFVVAHVRADPNAVFAGSVPYLLLAGNLVAGWQLARALLVAERKLAAGEDVAFMRRKIAVARFYAEHVLTRVPGLRDSVVDGAGGGDRAAHRDVLSEDRLRLRHHLPVVRDRAARAGAGHRTRRRHGAGGAACSPSS